MRSESLIRLHSTSESRFSQKPSFSDEISSRSFLCPNLTHQNSLFKGIFLYPRFLNLVKKLFRILRKLFLIVLYLTYLFISPMMKCLMVCLTCSLIAAIYIFLFCSFCKTEISNFPLVVKSSPLKIKRSIN